MPCPPSLQGVRYLLCITAFGVVLMSSVGALQESVNRESVGRVESQTRENRQRLQEHIESEGHGQMIERVKTVQRDVRDLREDVQANNSLLWYLVLGILTLCVETGVRIWQKKAGG